MMTLEFIVEYIEILERQVKEWERCQGLMVTLINNTHTEEVVQSRGMIRNLISSKLGDLYDRRRQARKVKDLLIKRKNRG